jgi:hypothetical protein
VPGNFKGKYQVKVEIDLGPFEATQQETWRMIE